MRELKNYMLLTPPAIACASSWPPESPESLLTSEVTLTACASAGAGANSSQFSQVQSFGTNSAGRQFWLLNIPAHLMCTKRSHGVWNFTTREFYSPEFYYPLFGIVGYIGRYIESNIDDYDEEFYYP
jgi:hypothetical protein